MLFNTFRPIYSIEKIHDITGLDMEIIQGLQSITHGT